MSSYSKGGSSSYGSSYGTPGSSSRGAPGREQYGRYQGASQPGSSASPSGGRGAYGKYDYQNGGRLGNSSGIRSHAASSRAQTPSRYQASQEDSEEEYDMIKSQIGRVKQDTLESTRNSKRTLEQTDKVARETLTKLGQQTEQLVNMDRKLEDTMITAEDSVQQSHKLQVLSGSIFRPHVKNPFTRKKRDAEKLAKLEQQRQEALRANERSLRDVQASQRRIGQYTDPGRHHDGRPAGRMDANGRIVSTASGRSRGERSRYMLEDEDPEVEDEIDQNLDDISHSVGMLKKMSLAMRSELKAQEDPLSRLAENADKTSSHVGMASYRLDRIK
ncbi:Protein transport protein S9 plasma membrane t-SNARE [Coemansia sp. RSA 1290]|nr:Protein transport protein S9 plasma membrane t-SNARE [Coemansia sp. RSA 1290]KAJ2653256.1 Protein transport protein S9 plasma membrane t-SNARE [Coemansia sp. RSA 1250]